MPERASDAAGNGAGTVPAMRNMIDRVATDTALYWAWAVATIAVAAIAFIQSYSHISALGNTYGDAGMDAHLLPISVDGLIVLCSLALIRDARRGGWGHPLTWGLLVLGIAATVAGNVVFGYGYGPIGIASSGWPAVAFLGSMAVAEREIRNAKRNAVPAVPEEGNGEDHVVVAIRQEFADDLARGRVPRVTDIKERIGVGTARASAARKVLLASLPPEAVAA